MSKARLKHIILAFCIPLLLGLENFADAGVKVGNKKVLLIGVSTYSDKGWGNIPSVLTDLDSLNAVLLRQGFRANDIVQLRDQDATLEGARRAIRKLIDGAQSGDIIHFHFSGHGQQVFDTGDDEEDGLDECLVMHNGLLRWDSTIKNPLEGHWTDDELGAYLEMLQNKVGSRGQVIVSLDASHSGPDSKGENTGSNYTTRGGMLDSKDSEDLGKGNLAVFSASLGNELGYEHEGLGAWTYAYVEAMRNYRPHTVGGLYARISAIMNKEGLNQTPTLTGNGGLPLYEMRVSSAHGGKDTTGSHLFILSIGISSYGMDDGQFRNCRRDAYRSAVAVASSFKNEFYIDRSQIHRYLLTNECSTSAISALLLA